MYLNHEGSVIQGNSLTLLPKDLLFAVCLLAKNNPVDLIGRIGTVVIVTKAVYIILGKQIAHFVRFLPLRISSHLIHTHTPPYIDNKSICGSLPIGIESCVDASPFLGDKFDVNAHIINKKKKLVKKNVMTLARILLDSHVSCYYHHLIDVSLLLIDIGLDLESAYLVEIENTDDP
ncbi:hypothetical protein BDB01DRAFT_839950 [Pilobolus umbonatus]|nr:hypothetical protein BDB01DRAFT_839950 [Pilobolus umbonatus]